MTTIHDSMQEIRKMAVGKKIKNAGKALKR